MSASVVPLSVLCAALTGAVIYLLATVKSRVASATERERQALNASAERERQRWVSRSDELHHQFAAKISDLERRTAETLERRTQQWIETRSAEIQREAAERAEAQLSQWRADEEDAIRRDAISKSVSVVRGKITEHLVPYMGQFPFDPRDCRFIGAPIDLVVFDGLYGDGLREVIFVEVKTGNSSLSPRERSLRDAIKAGRVRWETIRVSNGDEEEAA